MGILYPGLARVEDRKKKKKERKWKEKKKKTNAMTRR